MHNVTILHKCVTSNKMLTKSKQEGRKITIISNNTHKFEQSVSVVSYEYMNHQFLWDFHANEISTQWDNTENSPITKRFFFFNVFISSNRRIKIEYRINEFFFATITFRL